MLNYLKKVNEKISEILSIVMITFVIISIAYYTYFLQVQLFNERKVFFAHLTDKVAENIDYKINSVWNYTASCEQILYMSDVSDVDTLSASLERMCNVAWFEDNIMLAVNQNGEFYSTDKHIGKLEKGETLLIKENGAEKEIFIINIPYIEGDNKYFVFLKDLEHSIDIKNGEQIVSIAIAVNATQMQELVMEEVHNNNGHIYLLDKDGRRVYKSIYAGNFIEGDNVLDTIDKKSKFIFGGSMIDFRKSFEEGTTSAFEIKYSDDDWFVSNAVLKSADCNLLLFIPTKMISVGTANVLRGSIIFFCYIMLSFIVLVGNIIIGSRLSESKDHKMLMQQREMNKLLKDKAEIAESANRAKSEFLSYMSHDIRTPLSGIMGMTELAKKNSGNAEKVLDYLNKITDSSNHLLSLINDVLDMRRIESGKARAEYKAINIKEVIESCTIIIDGKVSNRDLEFLCEFGEYKFPNLLGDELHLRQILINILGNAVKFTRDGGKIFFRVKEEIIDDKKVKYIFEIEDTGIGMSDEFLEHIWEDYAQEDRNLYVEYRGAGLGMSITKKFVDMLDGDITVDTKLNVGSKFRVEIPFDIDYNVCEEKVIEKNKVSLNGVTILLAEDNEIIRGIAEELLFDEGVKVVSVDNGKLAYETFLTSDNGEFDVIIMDGMMPIMDGYEATELIRRSSHEQAKTIPIIAMTANAFKEDEEKAVAAGMNEYISKPFDIDVLLNVICKVVHRN